VFTARYAVSPYIKDIRFVFKGLIRKYPAENSGIVGNYAVSFDEWFPMLRRRDGPTERHELLI
jgi:hypothetical protein